MFHCIVRIKIILFGVSFSVVLIFLGCGFIRDRNKGEYYWVDPHCVRRRIVECVVCLVFVLFVLEVEAAESTFSFQTFLQDTTMVHAAAAKVDRVVVTPGSRPDQRIHRLVYLSSSFTHQHNIPVERYYPRCFNWITFHKENESHNINIGNRRDCHFYHSTRLSRLVSLFFAFISCMCSPPNCPSHTYVCCSQCWWIRTGQSIWELCNETTGKGRGGWRVSWESTLLSCVLWY